MNSRQVKVQADFPAQVQAPRVGYAMPSFGATTFFIAKQSFGLPCAYCGKKMLTQKEVNEFISESCRAKGLILIDFLSSKKEYYSPTIKEVVDKIIALARHNPELNIRELIRLELQHSRTLLEKEQLKIFAQIKMLSKRMDGKSAIKLNNLVFHSERRINQSTESSFFKRKPFLEALSGLKRIVQDKSLFREIYELAEKMPSSSMNANAFLVKYSRKGLKTIMSALIMPSISTVEHVRPRSLSGENALRNYIGLCYECNSNRGNKPYSELLREQPSLILNIKRYLQLSEQLIQTLNLDTENSFNHYKNYIEEIKATLNKEFQGIAKF